MKKTVIKTILGSAAAIALVAGLMACGSSDSSTPQGQVTKGPVNGSTVKDKDGVVMGITDANGMFPMSGEGPFTSTGGTFVDLATGVVTAAPDLKAPAGAKNITPITTLVAENPNDTALLEKIKSLGIAFDDSLSTVTAANKDAITLNECIGAAIFQIKKSGGDDIKVKAFLTSSAVKVKELTVTSGIVLNGQIETKMKDAAAVSLGTLAAGVNTKLHDTYVIADKLKVDDQLPTVTGSTGGTNVK
jgi:hypothetical protein